ncbi:Uncharacterized protein FWK35_00026536, partial [Aphis craccivora]
KKYKVIITAIYQCSEEPNNLPLKFNTYSSKKSFNITEVRGNFTFEIPFDDSLIFNVNFASWSLTGGWKPNSLVYVTNNACSKLKVYWEIHGIHLQRLSIHQPQTAHYQFYVI